MFMPTADVVLFLDNLHGIYHERFSLVAVEPGSKVWPHLFMEVDGDRLPGFHGDDYRGLLRRFFQRQCKYYLHSHLNKNNFPIEIFHASSRAFLSFI